MDKQLMLTKEFAIRCTETDLWDRLHLDSLFSMMQEVASDHAAVLGTGNQVLDDRGFVYLLSGISLRLESYPVWGETLRITTWCREIVQLYFMRDFIIETVDGRKIASATSAWFLTDKETHRPLRPSVIDDLTTSYTFPDKSALGFNASRLKKERLELPEQSNFTKYADFSDLDRNRHVNNTRYVAWSIDYFFHRLGITEPQSIKGIDINYLAEVKYQEIVQMVSRTLDSDLPATSPKGLKAVAIEGRDDDQKALFRTILHY